jgi:hypothetical protein
MRIIQLIVMIIFIGVLMWAVHYLGGGFIEPIFLTIADRVAVVGVVILVAWCVLSLFGWAPWPNWPRGPGP